VAPSRHGTRRPQSGERACRLLRRDPARVGGVEDGVDLRQPVLHHGAVGVHEQDGLARAVGAKNQGKPPNPTRKNPRTSVLVRASKRHNNVEGDGNDRGRSRWLSVRKSGAGVRSPRGRTAGSAATDRLCVGDPTGRLRGRFRSNARPTHARRFPRRRRDCRAGGGCISKRAAVRDRVRGQDGARTTGRSTAQGGTRRRPDRAWQPGARRIRQPPARLSRPPGGRRSPLVCG
jgi:hypothetical protein